MMNSMNMGWGMELVWIIGLILLVIIIYLVVKVRNQKRSQSFLSYNSPLNILKKRYAIGDISKKKFLRIKRKILKF